GDGGPGAALRRGPALFRAARPDTNPKRKRGLPRLRFGFVSDGFPRGPRPPGPGRPGAGPGAGGGPVRAVAGRGPAPAPLRAGSPRADGSGGGAGKTLRIPRGRLLAGDATLGRAGRAPGRERFPRSVTERPDRVGGAPVRTGRPPGPGPGAKVAGRAE